MRGIAARRFGSADATARSTFSSRPSTDRIACASIAAALLVQQGQLFERHRARLVEPAEVRREVGDRRLAEHPCSRLVDVAEPQHGGVGPGRRMVEEGGQVGVGFEMLRANERFGASQQALLGGIAVDAGERGQLRRRRPIVHQVLESRR